MGGDQRPATPYTRAYMLGMWLARDMKAHVWMTRAIPEGRRTRRQLVQLVRRRAVEGARAEPALG